jgi:transcriptional regulator with XRE-family HTH domain
MTIGKRLREERERFGLSQPAFAALAKTTKQTLFSWESEKTAPDGFQFAAFAAAGVDVLYVLTGVRTPQVTIPPDEQVLLDSYRRCNQQSRAHLIQTAALLSAGMQPVNSDKPSRKNGVKVSSTHGHAAGRDVHVNPPPSGAAHGQHNSGDGVVQVGHVGGNFTNSQIVGTPRKRNAVRSK